VIAVSVGGSFVSVSVVIVSASGDMDLVSVSASGAIASVSVLASGAMDLVSVSESVGGIIDRSSFANTKDTSADITFFIFNN